MSFRAPHHSCSVPALIGGGKFVKPREISLAHHGVLFLDEFAELLVAALNSLRRPIETGNVLIFRADGRVSYPAKFQLIATMNPCKCRYFGEPTKECSRAAYCYNEYTFLG